MNRAPLNRANDTFLFGGSFDPIHEGHIAVATSLLAQFSPKKFYFVPAARNPFKGEPQASPSARQKMIELVLGEVGDARLGILDWELHEAGPSYTVNTLQRALKEWGRPLTFVVGAEVFKSLPQWRSPKTVLLCCHWVVVHRLEAPAKTDLKPFDPREILKRCGIDDCKKDPTIENAFQYDEGRHLVQWSKTPHLPYASSEIRKSIAAAGNPGQNKASPPGLRRSVWLFIKENHLYAVRERGSR